MKKFRKKFDEEIVGRETNNNLVAHRSKKLNMMMLQFHILENKAKKSFIKNLTERLLVGRPTITWVFFDVRQNPKRLLVRRPTITWVGRETVGRPTITWAKALWGVGALKKN